MLTPLTESIGITRLADITGLDCLGIPTVLAIRPNAKHLSVSVGKGVSLDIAKVSAIMESMELYHLENPPPPVIQSSYHSLTQAAISPAAFTSGFFFHPYLEKTSLPWTVGVNLLDQQSYYIPHDLINLDTTELRPGLSWFAVSTNGVAAGNTLDEAICHALYEIVERESLQRWKHLPATKKHSTLIMPKNITTPISASLLEKFFLQHFHIKIWDITSDMGVSAFHCAVSDPNPFRLQGIFRGSGAHFSKDLALARALTEAAQSRLSMIAGSRDDIFPAQYQNRVAMLMRDENANILNSEISSQPLDVAATKNTLLECLHQLGDKKILLINHTKPGLKIPVVQIIVPGMLNDH